jgi:ribosome-associated protein
LATLARKAESQPEEQSFLAYTHGIANFAADKKAVDIRGYDVRGLTLMTDAFVLCTATSEPQMKAVMNAVRDGMRQIGKPALHMEGDSTSGWLLLDFGSVILHVFRENARAFYDLDGLWGDAKRIALDLDPA